MNATEKPPDPGNEKAALAGGSLKTKSYYDPIQQEEAVKQGKTGTITRPGISSEFLERHNIRQIDEVQAEAMIGHKASGVFIPYPGLSSSELRVNDRPFGRLRLGRATNGVKYLSPRGSGAQLYVPQMQFSSDCLVIVEGELRLYHWLRPEFQQWASVASHPLWQRGSSSPT